MKRPDMPANPFQELAADLASEIVTHLGAQNGLAITTLPAYEIVKLVITNSPAVGTLLQAERAATYQRVISHVAHMEQLASNSYSKSSLTTVRERIDEWLMESPEAASALAAVVQRETAKAQQEMRDMGFVHPHDQSRMILSGAAHQRISVLEEVFKAYYGEPSHQFEAWLKEAMQAAITAQMALK